MEGEAEAMEEGEEIMSRAQLGPAYPPTDRPPPSPPPPSDGTPPSPPPPEDDRAAMLRRIQRNAASPLPQGRRSTRSRNVTSNMNAFARREGACAALSHFLAVAEGLAHEEVEEEVAEASTQVAVPHAPALSKQASEISKRFNEGFNDKKLAKLTKQLA